MNDNENLESRVSEHGTTSSQSSIGMSDINAATRQFINATGGGRSGTPAAGYDWNQPSSSLKNLSEWVGRMFNTTSGSSDGSLTVGPHAYTEHRSLLGNSALQNSIKPEKNIRMGAMRQHTPLTIMTRVVPRTANGTYYNATDGQIILRPFGVDGLTTSFSVTIAGDTKTYASNSAPASWWTGLGSTGVAMNAYRISVSWTQDGHTQTVSNMCIFLGESGSGSGNKATFHGVYGWAPVMPDSNNTNYISKTYGVWTSRDAITGSGGASKSVTGGSQVPNATSAGQEEYFQDWFYAPSKNIMIEFAGDDEVQVEIREDDGTNGGGLLYDSGLVSGRFNQSTPHVKDLTLNKAGWHQIVCRAKEGPGNTAAHIGTVIWDKDAHGTGGPPMLAAAKAETQDGFSVAHSDGFIWTSRRVSGYATTAADGNGYDGNNVFYKNNAQTSSNLDAGANSCRVWWLSQQGKIYLESQP